MSCFICIYKHLILFITRERHTPGNYSTFSFYSIYIFISNQGNYENLFQAIKRSYELILYFIILTFISLLGNSGTDGMELISPPLFYTLIVVSSLSFYFVMVYRKIPKKTDDVIPTFSDDF
ncbi:hypothetical protein [Legionella tunisiensis]|uniref:hypothetical protein n=1 Tax=Legionella tunisiensis TaxID=1034944 RepID=UPI0002F2188D|nr:hypothetical protein [Legionella tunisiensis]